nr:reverse transcriptase domain-containing protein [Tanacetum cinerariifolium]
QEASPAIVEPLRIENPFLEDQFQEDPPKDPPEVPMADDQTMAELLRAPTEGYEDAIVIPEIAANNFELKHGLINLVQNKQFFGHDKEDPHAHIRYFNKITSTMKVPNVPSSSIKLMLFPFSLEGEARIWLEKEAPRSILTWEDLVSKFINQACPHHGFSELHQLDTFYNALNVNDQNSLNSAADGNFLDKMPRECLKIIESKSKVRQTRAKEVVAKVSTSSSTLVVSSEVAKLKDMVRALLLDKKNQSSAPASSSTLAPVKAVEPNCVTCGANYNQRNTGFRPQMVANQIRPPGFPPHQNNQNNFNRGNNFNQNRGGNFNRSNFNQEGNFNQGQLHRPQVIQPLAYQAPIPQTQSVSKTDFESYVKANDAVMRNMQNQGQNLQIQMANLTDMLSKFISSNTASSLGSGTLPSNTVTNPKEDLKGITTRSGVAYQGPTIPNPSKQGTKVTKDQVQTSSSQSTAPVQPSVIQSETQTPVSELVVAPVSVLMPNLKPFIPCPSRRDNKRRPLIGNKEKLSEMARTPMNEHCSAVILNKLPRKLRDPDKFLISCEFPGMDECLALADLGASINLMPLSVWEGLSLPELTPTCMNLELADRSVSKPIGITKDVSVKEADAFLGLEDDPNSPEFNPFYYDLEGDILLLEVILNSKPLPPLPNQEQYFPSFKKELKVCEAKTVKSSVDEPPEVELKDLPPHLEYAFLEGDNKLPVIIAKELGDEEKSALIKVLKSHKRAIAWKLSDIQHIGRISDQFMVESAKRHEENSNIIKGIQASTNAAIRNQGSSIKTLKIQIGQMSKVLQERGIGGLPGSTEPIPRDHVKSILATKVDSSEIHHMGCSPYAILGSEHRSIFLKQFPSQGDYKTTHVMIGERKRDTTYQRQVFTEKRIFTIPNTAYSPSSIRQKISFIGSMFMANEEDCLDGWDGAGGGEVKGGGVDLGVVNSLLGEILEDVIGERCGDTIRVDGGAVW